MSSTVPYPTPLVQDPLCLAHWTRHFALFPMVVVAEVPLYCPSTTVSACPSQTHVKSQHRLIRQTLPLHESPGDGVAPPVILSLAPVRAQNGPIVPVPIGPVFLDMWHENETRSRPWILFHTVTFPPARLSYGDCNL